MAGYCPFPELVLTVLCRSFLSHLIVDKPTSLNELGYFICYMARKQKPVSRLNLVGKSHECQRIATQGKCHPPTDNLWRLLHVIDGSDGETPVGNRAPEVLQKIKRKGREKSETTPSCTPSTANSTNAQTRLERVLLHTAGKVTSLHTEV